jgi:hypothetical protein
MLDRKGIHGEFLLTDTVFTATFGPIEYCISNRSRNVVTRHSRSALIVDL